MRFLKGVVCVFDRFGRRVLVGNLPLGKSLELRQCLVIQQFAPTHTHVSDNALFVCSVHRRRRAARPSRPHSRIRTVRHATVTCRFTPPRARPFFGTPTADMRSRATALPSWAAVAVAFGSVQPTATPAPSSRRPSRLRTDGPAAPAASGAMGSLIQ